MGMMKTSPRTITAFAAPIDNPQSVEETAAAIQKTFADFQAKNDERLTQVQKGLEDAVTKDEVEKLNAQLTTLTNTLETQAKQIGRMNVGGAGTGIDADTTRAAAKFLSIANRKRVRPGIDAIDVEAYQNYSVAFDSLVRQEAMADQLPHEIRASLSIGSDRDGGYLVPTEMSTEMEKRLYETSPMRQVARTIPIGRSAWEAPYKSSKGVSGGWVGERQARPATGTSTLGVQRIEVHEQYAYPETTQDMLDDALDVESLLIEDTEDEMSRQENAAFISGDGVVAPKGFLGYAPDAVTTDDDTRPWGSLQYVASGAAGGFPKFGATQADNPDAFIELIATLHPTYRASANWAMNRRSEAAIRKLRDADGRYLTGFGDIRDGALGFTLHGFPIVNFEDMPDIASDSFPIALGDWRRGYYIIDRQGWRVLRDPFTNKPFVGFYITKRTGGDIRNFDAIKLMKMAA